MLLIPLLVVWWPGCRQYPAVSSRESLSLMQLLYTACNTRDEKRLADAEKGVEKLTREGKMTAEERAGFDRIIGMARAGKWEDAEQAAFKFTQDQVGQGDDTPDDHDHRKHPPPKKGNGK
ncbi:MAG: hypothetical protein K2X82_27775 [Gemmataceae bacterium]|nr:hypothetical protein [Gemmataceae bacterium]